MKEIKPNKTFVIKHKATGELFRAASGKTSWKAPAHAKNAFNHSGWNYRVLGIPLIPTTATYTRSGVEGFEIPRFDEQDVYEIVELKLETESVLDQAKNLLREILGRCDYNLNQKIEKFLEDNK